MGIGYDANINIYGSLMCCKEKLMFNSRIHVRATERYVLDFMVSEFTL